MTSNSLRSFASGLIVAASVCAAVYYLGPSEVKDSEKLDSTEKTSALSVDEMKSMLSTEGYVIHTEEEWKQQNAAKEQVDTQSQEAAAEKVVYRTMLSVSSGMTSIDVGDALAQAKIIPDGWEFAKEIENRGLSNELRPGLYEIESGKTIDEIIAIIFQ
ncbi:MltG/YceG/YrrL family protein [Niallia endozanthoxylica]|uniref:Endolytic transglycosylase MltG n=1 Tax=Niallia endozanthoxylica TaxID=2036016 RepID=A0A5J5HU14_9BACI|nr:endolytic transglycosylase MltG [Niallia endozanthoxylica]KAA9025661.1 endolytic transglycosylase MltG [Niallia endozanthoxylica]